MSDTSRIVGKLWSYCNVLRDDGLSYLDYLEQLTYLLFLKMADEQTRPPWNRPSPVPSGYDWKSLVGLDGAALETHYRELLEHLGRQHGLLGLVFRKAQNKVQDPAKLKRLVSDLIDREQWVSLGADVKGDAYEGLLERNAQDTKSGAGQYFTPRPLIDSMVTCVAPCAGETIADPACGTGGFLLAAHRWTTGPPEAPHPLTREQREHLRLEALRGVEIVQSVTRLCAMNLLLHNVGPTPQELANLREERIAAGDTPEQAEAEVERRLPVRTDDALRELGSARYEVVLTNPPFGRKSSILVVGEDGDTARESITYEREDFWATTTNKQLNFVQHVKSLLQIHGRAAVVVPDNVLFEGGAGETVRRKLLDECDVHSLLRLPTGIFYAQGVKANVLFFDRASRRVRVRGRDACGSTTCAPTSTSRSRPTRCSAPTSRSSRRSTAQAATVKRGSRRGARRTRTAAGGPTSTTNWSPATSAVSTSSGFATRAGSTPRTCRRPTRSPPRLPTTCAAPWSRSKESSATSKQARARLPPCPRSERLSECVLGGWGLSFNPDDWENTRAEDSASAGERGGAVGKAPRPVGKLPRPRARLSFSRGKLRF